MLLYICKNCSGYHWFQCQLPDSYECDNVTPIIQMGRVTNNITDIELIRKLRISAQYDYCFIKDEKKFILALNNIPEHRRGNDGRPISIRLIFIAEPSQKILLFKILLDMVCNFTSFATLLDKCFRQSLESDCVLCSWKNLSGYFEKLGKQKVSQTIVPSLSQISGKLIAASPESTRTMRELGFSDSEIKKAIRLLSTSNTAQLLISNTEPIGSTIEDNAPEKQDTDAQSTVCDAIDVTENDPTPDSTDDVGSIDSDKIDGTSCNNLRAELRKVEKEKKQLIDKLEISTKRHECEREELNSVISGLKKKERYLNGIIAVLSAIIIILIIVNLLK